MCRRLNHSMHMQFQVLVALQTLQYIPAYPGGSYQRGMHREYLQRPRIPHARKRHYTPDFFCSFSCAIRYAMMSS
jgi:hypothetical protein